MKTRIAILLLLSVGLLSVNGLQESHAQTGMTMNVTTTDGTDITISGETTKDAAISATVLNTNSGRIVNFGQQNPASDTTYSFTFSEGSQGFADDGIYRVTVKQADSAAFDLSVSIKVENGRVVSDNVTKSSLSKIEALETVPEQIIGLMLDVTADVGADVMIVDGMTTSQANAITVKVTSPTGNVVHTDQLNPSQSGRFSTDINIGCPNWEEAGVYTITVQQGTNGLFKKSADVEIDQCLVVPEFGAIAMAILVISIVAIVVLGARSRLSIIPRY